MKKLNQNGSIASIVMIIAMILLLIGTMGFATWAYLSRQDYKTNSDVKSAEAVVQAEELQKTKLEAEFVERDKLPYDVYSSPASAGSMKITYPKTWSAYVDESGQANGPVNGFFAPGFVPNTIGIDNIFALRVQVKNTSYDNELKQYDAFIKSGTIRLSPYRAPLVPSVLGSRLDGAIVPGSLRVNGSLVMFPLRDKTIMIWTESETYIPDFEVAVLANLTFIP